MSFINNFVGFCKKSSLPKLGKSDTINMFVSKQDSSETTFQTILRPMPGYKQMLSITGEPQGLYRVSRGYQSSTTQGPVIYGVWGGKLYAIEEKDDGTLDKHEIGSLSGTGRCSFCETSGYGKTHPHLVICDSVNLYCVDVTLSWAEQATYFAAHSPIEMPYAYPGDDETVRAVPGWVAYLYGYLIVGAKDTDIFYRSYQYPFERTDNKYDIFELADTENVGYYTMSEWQPDNTVMGCSNGSRLITLGETSYQVFTWQDSTTTPFSSPDTASKKIGINNKDSLAMYGDNIFWLGSADHGSGVIYALNGDNDPARISTDTIEEIISSQDTSNVRAHCLRYRSHVFYILTFLSSGTTIAYDVGEADWVRLSSKSGTTDSYYRYFGSAVTTKGTIVTQANGVLAQITEEKWNEHDGTAITRKRVGGMLSSDNKPFKINRLQLITNNGEYPLTSDEVNFNMQICRDGATMDAETIEYLGENGEYDYDPVFKHLGKAKYFALSVSTSSNIPFALYGIDVKATSCGR